MSGEDASGIRADADSETVVMRSESREDTFRLGRLLGEVAEAGDVYLLRGDFGAGKTVLVQGLAAGLGVATAVTSPSFVLATEHHGRLPLYHLDLFRLERIDSDLLAGVYEYLEGDGVCAIEWPERLAVPEWLSVNEVRIEHRGEHERSIRMRPARAALANAARRAIGTAADGRAFERS